MMRTPAEFTLEYDPASPPNEIGSRCIVRLFGEAFKAVGEEKITPFVDGLACGLAALLVEAGGEEYACERLQLALASVHLVKREEARAAAN